MDDTSRTHNESGEETVLERFDALIESVDQQLDAHAAPEPTLNDIVSYVDKVRVRIIENP